MRVKTSIAIHSSYRHAINRSWAIPGAQMALRADLGITLNGSNVSVWADQSGNGKNASQGTGANRPLFVANSLNGQPGISFDGINHFLGHSLTIGNSPQHYTIFAVCKAATNNANGALYNPIITLGGTGPDMLATIGNTHSGCYNNGDIDASSLSDNNGSLAGPAITGGIFSATVPSCQIQVGRAFNDQDFYCADSPKLHKTTGSSGYGNFAGGNNIGSTTSSTRRLLGTIYEVCVWNRDLITSEIIRLQTYATARYGVVSPPINRLVLHGNSLLAAIGGGQTAQTPPRITIQSDLGSSWWVQQQALAGKQTGQLTTEYSTLVSQYFDSSLRKNILLVWEIVNDILNNAADGPTAYAHCMTYVAQAKADHPWDTVLLGTMIKTGTGTGTTETKRTDCNTLIMDPTNQAANGYVPVDFGSDPVFDVNDSTIYQVDKIHLTGVGYVHVGHVISAAVQACG